MKKWIALLIGGSIVAAIASATIMVWPKLHDAAAVEEYVSASKSAARKIDVNTATVRELQKLPGIGPELAERIAQYRPYHKLDELIAKKVLGRKQFARVKERIRVRSLSRSSMVQ